jgi:hypothetical protein
MHPERNNYSMWLYQHHTAGDIIDLDHETGNWRPIGDEEKRKHGIVLADLPVKGSYTIENDKRYCNYWTPDNQFVYRTPDHRVLEICRKDGKGTTIMPSVIKVDITPSKYSDGRLRQNYSHVVVTVNGKIFDELDYNSNYYKRLYGNDFTAASMVQDLSDWDFFVAFQGAVEIFEERVASGRVGMTYNDDKSAQLGELTVANEDVLLADSGEICTRAGVWAMIDDLRVSVELRLGDNLPQHNSQDARWVWSRKG